MSRSVKCKRIIAGKTYNTETATQLAGWDEEYDDSPIVTGEYLYQTRFGAFFVFTYQDHGLEEDNFDKIEPISPEKAQAWLENRNCVDIIEELFGKMPEAGSGESKFTLRMPDSLRDRLAERAKTNKQSLNAWIVRCLEAEASANTGERDVPPVGNMVGSNRAGWRMKGTER